MRILQKYRFRIGTKIPFDQWPGIIENFLHEQHLHHHSFHYYLESYDCSETFRSVLDGTKCRYCGAPASACERCRKEASCELRKGTGCERASKEHPFLGEIQTRKTQYYTVQSLHNFSEESNCVKEAVYAILTKLYRRYGFSETTLIYRDIDFFGRRVPTSVPDPEHFICSYEGSGITLHRSCLSNDNAIILCVESLYPGSVPDATPYADALDKLLPGVKHLSATTIVMDDDEQARYEELHRQAKPLVQQANDFFADHMPDEKGNGEPDTRVSVASWLKKFSKRYGYTYLGYDNFIYFLKKRLANGHYICLEFVSEPNNPGADPGVYLCGLGFRYEIWYDGFYPQNPHDASDYFTRLFDVLAEVEQTVFSAVLDLYPTTPGWFVPTILG